MSYGDAVQLRRHAHTLDGRVRLTRGEGSGRVREGSGRVREGWGGRGRGRGGRVRSGWGHGDTFPLFPRPVLRKTDTGFFHVTELVIHKIKTSVILCLVLGSNRKLNEPGSTNSAQRTRLNESGSTNPAQRTRLNEPSSMNPAQRTQANKPAEPTSTNPAQRPRFSGLAVHRRGGTHQYRSRRDGEPPVQAGRR